VTFAPGTSRFRVVSHAHQEQEIEGNKQEGNFVLEFLATATLAPEGATRLRLNFVIDSLRAEGGLISATEAARAKGARLTGILASNGEVTEFTGDSALTGQLSNVATSVRLFFPRVPPGGAQPGQQWSDTVETKTAGSSQVTIQSINGRRVVDWTEQAGRRALRIEVTSRYTLSGAGQQMGQDFGIAGDGERLTTQFLAADGHYLGATSHDSSKVTVTLTAMGMAFPSIQVRSDTVSTIP
jgi:hypothetical protein